MRVSRTSVRGYLRAGKILQLMEKFDVAAETYRYGLGLIAKEDLEARRLLEGMYEKVQVRARAVREREMARDPFSVLPVEIVDAVLKDLPFRTLMWVLIERVPTSGEMRTNGCMRHRLLQRVSRGWRRFLSEYRRSYTTLDFTGIKKPVSKLTIKAYLQRARGRTTKAVLEKFRPEMIVMVVAKSKKLSELSIKSADFLHSNFVEPMLQRDSLTVLDLHCQMDPHAALDIIGAAKNLEVLKCHRLSELSPEDLDIGGGLKLRKLVLAWDQPILHGGRIVSAHIPLPGGSFIER